jgi:hypothetical protein
MNEITITSLELQRALQVEYTIAKIHSAYQYEKETGSMKGYIGQLIKVNIEIPIISIQLNKSCKQ